MKAYRSTTKECGKYKEKIHAALFKNTDIRELLLGDISKKTAKEIREEFKEHVLSHLFVEDTMFDMGAYIFYDVRVRRVDRTVKNCEVLMYVVCHREVIDKVTPKEGYYGNKVDCLVQAVENALVNEDVGKEFGIGDIDLYDMDYFNSRKLAGKILLFKVPNFTYEYKD